MPVPQFIRAEQQRAAERSDWQKLQEDMLNQRRQAQADALLARAMSGRMQSVKDPVDAYPDPGLFHDKESFLVGQTEDAQKHARQLEKDRLGSRKELAEFGYKLRRKHRRGGRGNPYAKKFWTLARSVPADSSSAVRFEENLKDLYRRTPKRFRTPEMEQVIKTYPLNVKTKQRIQSEQAKEQAEHQRTVYSARRGGTAQVAGQRMHEAAKLRIMRKVADLESKTMGGPMHAHSESGKVGKFMSAYRAQKLRDSSTGKMFWVVPAGGPSGLSRPIKIEVKGG